MRLVFQLLSEFEMRRTSFVVVALAGFLFTTAPFVIAQDRLKSMPGSDQYDKMSKVIPTSVKLGALNVTWKDAGKAFEFQRDGILYRFDIAEGKASEIGKAKAPDGPPKKGGCFKGGGFKGGGDFKGVARGRQAASAVAPNG